MITGTNGVTTNTVENIVFGAGTIHRGLKYTPGESGAAGSWNFAASVVGATSGGSKFTITPEIVRPEIDGANVNLKDFTVKVGETASMEINFAELTKDIIKAATIGADGSSEDTTYDLIESKGDIATGDYWENIAFVGKTLKGKNIIVIMPNALCTSGLEMEGKNKEQGIGTYTFECHAEVTENSALDTLPWKIYYPKAVQA